MERQETVEPQMTETAAPRRAGMRQQNFSGMRQQIFSALVVVALLAGAGAWYSLAPQAAPMARVAEPAQDLPVAPQVGSRAPAVAMTDIRGQQVSLEGLKGQPVVLEFWAVWCPDCKKTMPIMDSIYREHQTGPKSFEVLAVSYPTNHDDVVKFVEKQGYSFRVAIDTRSDFINAYYTPGTPTTFFIDKTGVIRDWHLGPMDESEIRAKLAKITA